MFIPVPMLVEDWDLYQRLLDHLFSRHIKSQPEEHPVLMSEMPVWVPDSSGTRVYVALCVVEH